MAPGEFFAPVLSASTQRLTLGHPQNTLASIVLILKECFELHNTF